MNIEFTATIESWYINKAMDDSRLFTGNKPNLCTDIVVLHNIVEKLAERPETEIAP